MTDILLFIVSKLLGAATRPETVIVLLTVVAFVALWLSRLKLARRTLALAVTTLLIVGIFPIGQLFMGPLEGRFPVAPEVETPAGIIVLGRAENPIATRRWGMHRT